MSEENKDRDRTLLRRYLLDELDEAQEAEVEKDYLLDEESFDRLLDVENQLIDEYVRGLLSPQDARSFSKYLQRLPDVESRLATASALSDATPSEQTVMIAGKPRNSRHSSLLARLPHRFAFAQYALTVSLIVLLVAVIYLVISVTQLRHANRELQARLESADREQVESQRRAETAQQTQSTLEARINELGQQLSQVGRSSEQQTAGTVAVLVLSSALRSSGSPDILTLHPETKTIALTIPLDQESGDYRVILQSVTGTHVFTRDDVKSRLLRLGSVLEVRFPRTILKDETYKLTIQKNPTSAQNPARDFYFRVTQR